MRKHLILFLIWCGGFWLLAILGRADYLLDTSVPLAWKEHYWLVNAYIFVPFAMMAVATHWALHPMLKHKKLPAT